MAEYIEREAAQTECKKYKFSESYDAFVVDCILKSIPAADVAPVVHGRWIPFHSTAAGDIQYCSACDIGCTWRPNYCPNCGALMDLEGGNT